MPRVLACAAHVPYRRLDRAAIADLFGGSPAKGQRAVASYDEDTTSMGVEAARACLRSAPDGASPSMLWFATTEPTYTDKTNATTVHAALRLDRSCLAVDANGAVRSVVGALRAGLAGGGPSLVVGSDIRTGLATSGDEAEGGDAAAAVLLGDGPGIADLIGSSSVTEEFTDRWRVPGERRSRLWESRFGEQAYLALGEEAWEAALKDAGLSAGDVGRVVVTGTHSRAVARLRRTLGGVDDLATSVGFTGAASPLLLLTSLLESASEGEVVALVVLADGADVLLFRATSPVVGDRAGRTVAAQVAAGAPVPYGKYLSWRGMVDIEPPNRPAPARPSSSAAARRRDWKYGFVAGRDSTTGDVSLPPAALGDVEPAPLADAVGTVVSFTIDRMVYSPSPPVVFVVVDFDGGGRAPVEMTDVDPADVAVGDRVEMTFRRLSTADGIANYFWKARRVRG